MMDKTRDILNNAVAGQAQNFLGMLPNCETTRRDIRRNRQAALPPVLQAHNLQFIWPQAYCVTADGDQFLQVDSFANNSRMLMFGSQEGMDFLAVSQHWYMDGWHGTVTVHAIIHSVKSSKNVIGMYALLTNKQQHTYERMLRHIEILIGNANPTSISLDFERLAINACSTVYPLSELSGCFFHLSQNVYKRAQESHLTDLYQNNVV